MELANIKLDLARKLFNINDKELLNYIKAVLDTQSSTGTWYEDLPEEIKKDFDKGLAEARNGQGIPHAEARKAYSKWLKK